ncbi:MAG TPA: hypothetical protein EYF95_04165 [Flavobacteriales bacterium]|jgi:hypothetical protein|nr:hypothetical protein [Flavobacteriales bacterium]
MKIGDMVKFSKEHRTSPGHEYVEDWVGIIVEAGFTGFHKPIDEVRIMWTIHGKTMISHYDEIWWLGLNYEPFEVIND